MSPVPVNPKIYHITHVDNLDAILAKGCLLSDRCVQEEAATPTTIGMSNIKRRRLFEIQASADPPLFVGDFVPFNFCPRSVMLFVIHRGNHESLTYRDGQGPIVHLEADFRRVAEHCQATGRRWVVTPTNAGARYTCLLKDMPDLGTLDWGAITSREWSPNHKEHKQAEFLIHPDFPIELIERVGVQSTAIAGRVAKIWKRRRSSPPTIEVLPQWYY